MNGLSQQRILLCVGGGIAAYKSCELVRRLMDHGAEVQVVMTVNATHFVTPTTFQALSGRPARVDLFDTAAEAAMGHIEMARWASAVVLAPATADLMARIAHGLADDLATTLCLATRAPLFFAPAMNQQMWANAATQANLGILKRHGHQVIGPGSGAQACGDVGAGRMSEPNEIVEALVAALGSSVPPPCLAGKKVLITAGPTREAIDPVRYISNHSTGKQGFALAAAAAQAGANVTLVTGPVSLDTPAGVRRVDVESACDMYEAVLDRIEHQDVFIGVAAVADYRVARTATQKIKKKAGAQGLSLELIENPDIVAAVAQHRPRLFVVGFAAETEAVLENARAKRIRKGMDLIVVNDVANKAIGFNSDNNAVTLIWGEGERTLEIGHKSAIAAAIISQLGECLGGAGSTGAGLSGAAPGQ